MLIDENYIEFSISICRNVPVVNTKLCRFTVVLTSHISELMSRTNGGIKLPLVVS